MAETVIHKVKLTVWTPCSVLTALGCATLIGFVLIPTCVSAVIDPSPTPAPQSGR